MSINLLPFFINLLLAHVVCEINSAIQFLKSAIHLNFLLIESPHRVILAYVNEKKSGSHVEKIPT